MARGAPSMGGLEKWLTGRPLLILIINVIRIPSIINIHNSP